MELNGNLLTPTDPENWLCDKETWYEEDGHDYFSGFYKGIRLASVNSATLVRYQECSPEWKAEHEPKEPQEEGEDNNVQE